jgi:hypothetical protein
VGPRLGTVSLSSAPVSGTAAQELTRAVSSAEAGAGRGFVCFWTLDPTHSLPRAPPHPGTQFCILCRIQFIVQRPHFLAGFQLEITVLS